MCTFLAINTGSVQLIPITAIAVLAANGSSNPAAIIGTALAATLCSSVAGLVAVKTLERWRVFAIAPVPGAQSRIPLRRDAPDPSLAAPA
jgi:spore maturation protein A